MHILRTLTTLGSSVTLASGVSAIVPDRAQAADGCSNHICIEAGLSSPNAG